MIYPDRVTFLRVLLLTRDLFSAVRAFRARRV